MMEEIEIGILYHSEKFGALGLSRQFCACSGLVFCSRLFDCLLYMVPDLITPIGLSIR